jgi:hypothetical protein
MSCGRRSRRASHSYGSCATIQHSICLHDHWKQSWNRSGPAGPGRCRTGPVETVGPAGLRRFLPVYRLKKIPLYPLRFFSKMSFTTFEICNFFRVKYITSRFKLFYQNIINKFRPKRKKIMFFKFSGFNR